MSGDDIRTWYCMRCRSVWMTRRGDGREYHCPYCGKQGVIEK